MPEIYSSTLTQNENFTLFIIGFTISEIKTPVPPNAGNEIQSFVRMLNLIGWGVSLLKKNPKWFKVLNFPIYSIQREVIRDFESLKPQI